MAERHHRASANGKLVSPRAPLQKLLIYLFAKVEAVLFYIQKSGVHVGPLPHTMDLS
jgi:hypothetical protein